MAFMFETRFPQHLTRFASELESLQDNYADCWKDLKKRFNGTPEGDVGAAGDTDTRNEIEAWLAPRQRHPRRQTRSSSPRT